MEKKFILTITDDGNNIKVSTSAKGFSIKEIIGHLQITVVGLINKNEPKRGKPKKSQ